MEFRPITLLNLDEVIALAVGPEQQSLVADNLYSIAQAGLEPTAWCRAVYLAGKPVGFFSVKDRESGKRKYIWRFMVDARHQRMGIGRRVMVRLLDELFADPAVTLVELTIVREPGGPEAFYCKCGFRSIEEQIGSEWRMVLPRGEYETKKAAQPGATDNPGGAQ